MLDNAIQMFVKIGKWEQALQLASDRNHPDLDKLRSECKEVCTATTSNLNILNFLRAVDLLPPLSLQSSWFFFYSSSSTNLTSAFHDFSRLRIAR